MSITIRTNHHTYDLKCWHDLPSKVAGQDFGYLPDEERYCLRFVRYKGEWYDIGDMMRLEGLFSKEMRGWDQYQSNTYFSGILIKYVPGSDWEQVICGTYFS